MDYRSLGRTGVKVSPLCLGAMMFGGWGNPDHDDSVRIIHRALDAGINFIDTADVYSRGESEEIVGKALAGGRRDEVVLATKVHGDMAESPNHRGNSRRWIIREVEKSLRRLQTDYFDLYQMHRPDPDTDIDETLAETTVSAIAAEGGRAEYQQAGDAEVLDAFCLLSETEGIIPALEPAHALAWVVREAGRGIPSGSTVLVTLSGRGDKDVAQVRDLLAARYIGHLNILDLSLEDEAVHGVPLRARRRANVVCRQRDLVALP